MPRERDVVVNLLKTKQFSDKLNLMKKAEVTKLDKKWSEWVRDNYNDTCEICGKKGGTNAHHYYGRRARSTRWIKENGCCVCPLHHVFGTQSAHQAPEWFRKEMLGNRGQMWLDELEVQWNKICKADFETVNAYLEGERDNYC